MSVWHDDKKQRLKYRYHKTLVHLSDLHNHHPSHMSRRQGYNGHWHMGIDWKDKCVLGEKIKPDSFAEHIKATVHQEIFAQ